MLTGRSFYALLVAFTLCACASVNKPKPLPPLSSFAVVSETGTVKRVKASSTAKEAIGGVADGAYSGSQIGGVAAVACGPAAALCFFPGMFIGMVVGGTAVGISRGMKGLPGEVAKEVDNSLARLDVRRDFDRELETALVSALGDRIAEPESAAALIRLRLLRIDLRQHSKDRISLVMHADMTVGWDLSAKKPKRKSNRYQHGTETLHVDEWLANDGEGFSRGIDLCIARVSEAMARDLVQKSLSNNFRSGTERPTPGQTSRLWIDENHTDHLPVARSP